MLTRAAPSAGVTSIDEASEPVRFEDMMTAEEVFLTNSQDGSFRSYPLMVTLLAAVRWAM